MQGRHSIIIAAAETLAGILIVVLVSYMVAREALGNPFAGLGADMGLDSQTLRALSQAYGLNTSIARGALRFAAGLLKGDTGPSLTYGVPAYSLAIRLLPWTLAPILAGIGLSFAATILWVLFVGFHAPRPFRAGSFIPGYFYAVLVIILAWRLGEPSPLPGHSIGKTLVYTGIVWLAVFPRLLHGLLGLMEEPMLELKDYMHALRAIGLPEWKVRLRTLQVLLSAFNAYTLILTGMIIERSAIIEPILNYTGIGYLLYHGVVDGDPVLAATSFALIGITGYIAAGTGRAMGRTPGRGV